MTLEDQDIFEEKRGFPRIDTECPVMYAIGTSKKWSVGVLLNYSATGMSVRCKEQLLRNISINIITKPGSNKLVPNITASGKITRCEIMKNAVSENDEFKIACKLTKVRPS